MRCGESTCEQLSVRAVRRHLQRSFISTWGMKPTLGPMHENRDLAAVGLRAESLFDVQGCLFWLPVA